MGYYGNVPDGDVSAMRGALQAASQAVTRLPALSPGEWREAAFDTVLNGILEDWVANGTTELEPDDVEDLGNLLRVSADLALSMEEGLRDSAFTSLLRNAMSDWVQNWNSEE